MQLVGNCKGTQHTIVSCKGFELAFEPFHSLREDDVKDQASPNPGLRDAGLGR